MFTGIILGVTEDSGLAVLDSVDLVDLVGLAVLVFLIMEEGFMVAIPLVHQQRGLYL